MTIQASARAKTAPVTAKPRKVGGTVGRSLWWMALPALALYLYVVVVPTLRGTAYAFTDWRVGATETNFVGFDNFVELFQGDSADAAWRTLLIAVVCVVVQNVAGLGLAVLLNGRIRGRNLLRTIIFAPLVVSSLVVGYLFQYIFGPPGTGAVNRTLEGLGLGTVDFLGDPQKAVAIIIVAIVWQFTGSNMVIYLAGLQGVPEEVMEAASLDGAGGWARFWHITRPLLAPAITINLMLGVIGGLKIFDQVFAITQGGPAGQTKTIAFLIYELFSRFGQYSQAAALALLLAVVIALLAQVQYSALRRQERKAS